MIVILLSRMVSYYRIYYDAILVPMIIISVYVIPADVPILHLQFMEVSNFRRPLAREAVSGAVEGGHLWE